MSRNFGTPFQFAYVVDRLEPILDHMTGTLGIGPFFVLPVPFSFHWMEFRGERTDQHDIYSAVALGYGGDVMFEIIVPSGAPCPHQEFLERGGCGVHHIGMIATDYNAQMAAARAAGIPVVLELESPTIRLAYLETDVDFPGTMVEIMEPSREMAALFDQIKAASVNWDGSDPVRRL
jgi:hypothetical protein